MKIIQLPQSPNSSIVSELFPRAAVSIETVLGSVEVIVNDVRTGGLSSVLRQVAQFDSVTLQSPKVSEEALDHALDNLAPELRSAIEESIDRVRKVSQASLPAAVRIEFEHNSTVSTRYQPVDSTAVYAPGGKAVYPSSVIMNVVPAQVAGVKRIVLFSPAQSDGLPAASILATARLLEITEVYSLGGATAAAVAAFGISELELEPVAMLTGPGNIFLAAAKRLLRGRIGIDAEAGPTEILIIADQHANPEFVAWDLISQAEHDENAACVLITTSQSLANSVNELLPTLVATTKNQSRVEIALSSPQSVIAVAATMGDCVAAANIYATEHLSIQTIDSQAVAREITNAGAIFLGSYSPVSLGDYIAGSNHVLPTGAQALHSSGLGVHSFLRPQQIINYSAEGLSAVSTQLDNFSIAEGLPAHGQAAISRGD